MGCSAAVTRPPASMFMISRVSTSFSTGGGCTTSNDGAARPPSLTTVLPFVAK